MPSVEKIKIGGWGEKIPKKASGIYLWNLEPMWAPTLVSPPFAFQVKAGPWPCPTDFVCPWLDTAPGHMCQGSCGVQNTRLLA